MKQKAMSRLWSIPRKIYSETKPPLDEIYHHGIKGQKWGMKNGPPYPIQPDVAASKIRERAEKEVTKISNDVSQAAKHAGSKMFGLEHKLKTADSISRKIKSKGSDIKDAVRFTTISTENDFVSAYEKVKSELKQRIQRDTMQELLRFV